MVAFLFQQQKALCHFSLLVTPISLRIFSILLQKRRQYCLLRIHGRVTDIESRPRILTFLHLRKTGQNTLIPLGLVFW